MRYIDADRLKAEIERRRLSNRYIDTDGYEAELFEIITSLQQEQPSEDLEAEMRRFLANVTPSFKDGSYRITRFGFRAVARHFYELGQQAKKEE